MICKYCGKFFYKERGVISRKDNITIICSKCAEVEFLEEFKKYMIEKNENHISRIV